MTVFSAQFDGKNELKRKTDFKFRLLLENLLKISELNFLTILQLEPFKLVQYSRYIGVPMGPDREPYLNIAGKTFLDHVGRPTQTLLTIPSYLHATKRLTFLLENFSIPFSPTYFVFNPSLSLSLSLSLS